MVDKVKAAGFRRGDFQNYYETDEKRPVLIKGETSEWDATRKWDPEYMECMLGLQEVNVKFLEEEILDASDPDTWENITQPFPEARQSICEDGRYYLAQASIERPWTSRVATGRGVHFPILARDIRRPRFLDDLAKFLFVTNIWFGGDRCKTSLHYDISENFFVQIYGKKEVQLFSPGQTDCLYPTQVEPASHESRVNVFDPDESKFPRYTNAEKFGTVTVEPGDLLYIPRKWWHAVETLSTSISVNFWWKGPYRYTGYCLDLLSDRARNGIEAKLNGALSDES